MTRDQTVPFAEGTGSHQEVNAKLSHILEAQQIKQGRWPAKNLRRTSHRCTAVGQAKHQSSGVVQIDKRPEAPLPQSIRMHPDPSGPSKQEAHVRNQFKSIIINQSNQFQGINES